MSVYKVTEDSAVPIIDSNKIPNLTILMEALSGIVHLENYDRILLYKDDFADLCDKAEPTSVVSQQIAQICGLTVITTKDKLAKNNVFILGNDIFLKSRVDLFSIYFKCGLFLPDMPVKTKYNQTLFNESEKTKMKIVDERKIQFTEPEDFKEGDIALDADNEYFKIHLNEINSNDYCLESLDDGSVYDSSDCISSLLVVNTRLPLIRIKPSQVKLVIEND